MKACPVQITIQAAHHETTDSGHAFRLVLFGAPSLRVNAEITDLGPDLAAKIAEARAKFYVEKAADFAKYDAEQRRGPTEEAGTTVSVRCLAPRKPAGFDAAVHGGNFKAAPKPDTTA